jgi:hypothetical protein
MTTLWRAKPGEHVTSNAADLLHEHLVRKHAADAVETRPIWVRLTVGGGTVVTREALVTAD